MLLNTMYVFLLYCTLNLDYLNWCIEFHFMQQVCVDVTSVIQLQQLRLSECIAIFPMQMHSTHFEFEPYVPGPRDYN